MAAGKFGVYSSLVVFSLFLPWIASGRGVDQRSSLGSNGGFYDYTVEGGKCSEREVLTDFVPKEKRIRRYVGDVIPHLADNYRPSQSYPSHNTFDTDVSDWLTPELGVLKRGSRKMEMLGNLAVPVAESHQDFQPPTAESHQEDHSQVAAETEKPHQSKKPVDPFESSKKGSDANYKKVDSSQTNSTHIESDDDYTNISTDNFSKDISNNTLLKNNITEKKEDHYEYYNSTFIVNTKVGMNYWVDMDHSERVIIHEMLSKSHRRAATVRLSFDFPFYGHKVRNITIATGGFLYTGNHIHSWLAATQYIAPLMANFDTSISNNSQIRYMDNGTAFTVEWDRVSLQDKSEAGDFTFQVTLHSSGDIVFVYRDVPIQVEEIQDIQHPVKIGLSDAYIIDRTVFFVRRKTIYEYHRVNFKREDIKNWTVIYMNALPTCLNLMDCHSCLTEQINFACKWCPTVGRCSTGVDRMKQDWTQKQCDSVVVSDVTKCHLPVQLPQQATKEPRATSVSAAKSTEEKPSGSEDWHTGMLGILLTIAVISALAMWVLYAYRNPHTPSGQVLIKYRPSQWTLRRGEARYTAATIHM